MQRALTIVRAVRRDNDALRRAAASNMDSIGEEVDLLSRQILRTAALLPLRLPALDLLLSQQPRDVPAQVLVQASDVASHLALANDVQRMREGWLINGAIAQDFTTRLSHIDVVLRNTTQNVHTTAGALAELLEPLEQQLARGTLCEQYWRESANLGP